MGSDSVSQVAAWATTIAVHRQSASNSQAETMVANAEMG